MPDLIADTFALRELAVDYARHLDGRRPAAASALFAPDGVLRIVQRGVDAAPRSLAGTEQLTAAFARLERYDATFHFVGNHHIDVDGDSAVGEVYCLAHHLGADHLGGRIDHVMVIRYQDRYVRTTIGWRFAERELQVDWTEDRPVNSP